MTDLSKYLVRILALAGLALISACSGHGPEGEGETAEHEGAEPTAQAGEVGSLHVYSSRNEQLIQPIFAAFTAETGVDVTYTTGDEGLLMQKLKSEEEGTPASLLLTVDAGNLWQAKQMGLLSPVDSPLLQERIPAHLRDPENYWFGLSVRARTLVYHPDKVSAEELSDYADLAKPKWKGKLLLRTSKKVYNQSLVAMLIEEYGEQETEAIVRGWVDNLAAPEFSNDTKLMEALAAGVGAVGIVNTYYYGRLKKDNPDLPLKLFWAGQGGSGVHVNVSGAGVTSHAPNRQGAIQLMEWLAGDEAQAMFAGVNMEFPANPAVPSDPEVAGWGSFQPSTINLAKAGELQERAIKLMDRAGYK